jgi:hypothetical protein
MTAVNPSAPGRNQVSDVRRGQQPIAELDKHVVDCRLHGFSIQACTGEKAARPSVLNTPFGMAPKGFLFGVHDAPFENHANLLLLPDGLRKTGNIDQHPEHPR